MNKPQIRFKGFDDEWQHHSLSELGEVKMCKRILKSQTSDKGEVPFFKIGTFGKKPDAFISRELFDEYKRLYSYPNIGDIIVSAAGTIGRTSVYDGKPAYFQDSNLIWIDNDNSIIDNSFLAVAYPRVKWAVSSTTIARIYNETVRQTKTSAPSSIKEQQEIGNYFRQLDEIITEVEREISRLEKIKQASLQKIFPRPGATTPEIRFAGFSGPWKDVKLGELGIWQKGQSLSKSDISDTAHYPCLHYGQLFAEEECIYNIRTFTNKEPIITSCGNEILFPDSDVTPTGLGRCCCVLEKGVILGSGINIFCLKENMVAHFVALNVTCNKYQIIEQVTGTTVKHIHPKNLSKS